jgi:hypothetical protein
VRRRHELTREPRVFAALVFLVVAADAEPPDHQRQRTALHDQGDDRDREGDQDQLRAVRQIRGQRLGRGQRHDPAHARPR